MDITRLSWVGHDGTLRGSGRGRVQRRNVERAVIQRHALGRSSAACTVSGLTRHRSTIAPSSLR
ncbi:hypothetical protein XFF1815_40051 [Xanthomonas citri pv. fuscans]|nr:hypothetical protein XFF1815_40051 [Xanthomonas citri pv. fuscans]